MDSPSPDKAEASTANFLTQRCVASTRDKYNTYIEATSQNVSPCKETFGSGEPKSLAGSSNYFTGVQWSADGTTVITNSADRSIRTFVLPPDLLESGEEPRLLTPYSTQALSEPAYATTLYPGFNLSDPSTTLFLASVRDLPVRLNSSLAPGILASYPLVNPTTEAYITPHSLLFSASGNRFITGSDSLVCVFDVSRPGEGPISRIPTIPIRHKRIVDGGVGMRGIVSALSHTSTSNTLAAGTFSRHISLYISGDWLDRVGLFTVAGTEAEAHIGGSGITQLHWSPCGRYLYVAERRSDGVLIYDIRMTGQLLGWLEGRRADTQQRIGVDLIATGEEGHEIWAGGTDGSVKVWKNPHEQQGGQEASFKFTAHTDAVTSAVVHPAGTVVATCSGQRPKTNDLIKFATSSTSSDEDSEGSEESGDRNAVASKLDNSLKIWSL